MATRVSRKQVRTPRSLKGMVAGAVAAVLLGAAAQSFAEENAPAAGAGDKDSKTETASVKAFVITNGLYQYTIDSSEAPELAEWVEKQMVPIVLEWYPKIIELLPSENFKAPTSISIRIKGDLKGAPAVTSGDRISCNAEWFKQNLRGEALGCVVHEMVHIVQHYGPGGRGRHTPSWLTEGIADYIRWFLYEPQTRGAEISGSRIDRARHNASYRVSANFLDWASRTHKKELVQELNRAMREGRYAETMWKDLTGFPAEELEEQWLAWLRKKTASPQTAGS